MPVLEVNIEGVSFAMSFICGLATMATLIDPPFDPVPEAGEPLDVFVWLPPQPTAIAPTTANDAATDPRRRVPFMLSPPAWTQRTEFLRVGATYMLVCVGCQALWGIFQRN